MRYLLASVLLVASLFASSRANAQRTLLPTAPNLKVAFIADQGLGSNANAVLNLIKNEGAELVVHAGDLDYDDNPDAWDNAITRVLGPKFPYIISAGNHDVGPWYLLYYPWPSYQKKVEARVKKNKDLKCDGDTGVNAICRYKGLTVVLSGAGTIGDNHANYLRSKLKKSKTIWNVCSWHKVMEKIQVYSKGNEAGWDVYETCRQYGALIVNGHEHVYDRTKTLVDMRRQIVDSDPRCSTSAVACVVPGKTIKIGSGLGGQSVYEQRRCFDGCNGEWAAIYTKTQNARYGALFVVFNVNGDPYRAHGYFKNINGEIIDEFDIVAQTSAVEYNSYAPYSTPRSIQAPSTDSARSSTEAHSKSSLRAGSGQAPSYLNNQYNNQRAPFPPTTAPGLFLRQ